jgi:hypothetical protein
MPPELIAPTQREIDELASEIAALDAEVAKASKKLADKKDEVLPLIRKFGVVPGRAAKTKMLDGQQWELRATFGSSSELLPGAVERFKEVLKEDRKSGFFRKFFMVEKRYIASPESAAFLSKIPERCQTLFHSCWNVTPKKPSICANPKKFSPAAAALEQQRNELVTA